MPSTPFEAHCLTKVIKLDKHGNPVYDPPHVFDDKGEILFPGELQYVEICGWRGKPRDTWDAAAEDGRLHQEETKKFLGPTTIAYHSVWPV